MGRSDVGARAAFLLMALCANVYVCHTLYAQFPGLCGVIEFSNLTGAQVRSYHYKIRTRTVGGK